MRKRLLSVLALLALALVPVVASATEDTGPAGGTPVVLAKAHATVVGITPDGSQVELDVVEAHEWLDGAETRTLATGINGQHITANITPETMVDKGDAAVGVGALTPGTKILALLQADGQPVTTSCTFELRHAWLESGASKPDTDHPGHKFEIGFFPRLWHLRGPILGLERVEGRNVMNLDVRRLEHAPKRFRDEGSRLASLDAYVIVPDKVVITDEDGDRISFADLAVDDRVKVVGKFLRPELWMTDESGEPAPTLLAKRIKLKHRG